MLAVTKKTKDVDPQMRNRDKKGDRPARVTQPDRASDKAASQMKVCLEKRSQCTAYLHVPFESVVAECWSESTASSHANNRQHSKRIYGTAIQTKVRKKEHDQLLVCTLKHNNKPAVRPRSTSTAFRTRPRKAAVLTAREVLRRLEMARPWSCFMIAARVQLLHASLDRPPSTEAWAERVSTCRCPRVSELCCINDVDAGSDATCMSPQYPDPDF